MSNEIIQFNNSADFYFSQEKITAISRAASAYAKSTIIPKDYQQNPSNVLVALDMAVRMNMSPMQVMQSLYIINGRPSWSSQFIIGVINASGRYKHELMFDLQGVGANLSCYAWVTTKSDKIIKGPLVTIEMARNNGWLSKNGSKWQTMPEIMIRYRAASFFSRFYCPDLIMGLYSQEETIEIENTSEIIEVVTPEPVKPSKTVVQPQFPQEVDINDL